MLRRPQNFAKYFPYFWLCVLQSKIRGRFRKILWPSQIIWTLQGQPWQTGLFELARQIDIYKFDIFWTGFWNSEIWGILLGQTVFMKCILCSAYCPTCTYANFLSEKKILNVTTVKLFFKMLSISRTLHRPYFLFFFFENLRVERIFLIKTIDWYTLLLET